MIKQQSKETELALSELAKLAGGENSFHVAPVYVCDYCQNDHREAFPYKVYDRDGNHWDDLCNDCFELLGCSYPQDGESDYMSLSMAEQATIVRQAILQAVPTGVSFAAIIIALAECVKIFQEQALEDEE